MLTSNRQEEDTEDEQDDADKTSSEAILKRVSKFINLMILTMQTQHLVQHFPWQQAVITPKTAAMSDKEAKKRPIPIRTLTEL